MDPNLLSRMDYFPGLNAPNMDSPSQPGAGSSSAGAVQPGSNDGTLWDPSLALGMSDEITPAFLYTQQNLGGIPYGGRGGPSRTPRPAEAIQAATVARKRGGHDRKRVKMGSDAAALDSVDYWIHFDDDDHDNKGGSFEIDFSGRSNDKASFARPTPAFNTMASTPGLGTGLYTTANPSFFRAEDFIDDAALDNALSEDEDGLDTLNLNLADQLSGIDTAPPTDVPPREGLYSTPLSWEKPQPGLRSDPLLSSFNPSTPLLSDMEQQNLLAIALNTNRPPAANFGPGFGAGYGYGYGYDVLGGGFPTLGANAAMEGLGPTSLDDFSGPAEQPRPTSQPRPQPGVPPQAPQVSAQQAPAQSQHLLSGQVQQQRPQRAQNQQRRQVQLQPQRVQQPLIPPQPTQQPPKSTSPPQEQTQPMAPPQKPPPCPSESQGIAQPPTQPQELAAAEEAVDSPAQETAAAAGEKAKAKAKPGDRTAHNDIERKYRTNLKDRISELRDSVPALRAIPEEGLEEEDEGSQRLPKVSKGTVMTKAAEYIHLLERRNRAIMRDHQELSRRLQAFEQLLNATARQPFPMPSYSRTLFDPRGFC